jgi:RNAse (barnase) inhibitor barstar
MKIINIDASELANWESFHAYFKKAVGFPEYYGNNMDAWIDCMSDEVELWVLNLSSINVLVSEAPEIYYSLVECSAFVNYRSIEGEGNPIIVLSFFKH